MWSLVVESGKHKGRKVKLAADRVIIGRAEDAHIRVGSTDVSRHHCELLPTGHGVLVNDLGSRNGTIINGEVISTEFMLAPGNTLTVGPMAFRLLPRTPTTKPSPKGDQGLSDDDISDWLSDDFAKIQSDTTVVGGPSNVASDDAIEDATPPPDNRPWVPPPSRARFDSVADEAADIIRRHKEMVAAQTIEDAT